MSASPVANDCLTTMQIRVGYELIYDCPQPTPMVLMLNIHHTRARRIQAICNYVHRHITFSYQDARSTRTAWEALEEGKGVCRDYAHLAIAFCRCMNIPARYCTGYLSDIGIPPPYSPMDFAAWFEAYIGGRWHTFDPRNNIPRIGRVLIARGRDATDVAISNTFGPSTLAGFTVWTDEVR